MESSRRNLLVASAVTAALGTGTASALPPSAGINVVLYAAGDSDQENAAYWAVLQNMDHSTVDIYTDRTDGAPSTSYLIVTGAGGVCNEPANILFFYKFNGGGLANGVIPFAFSAGTSSANLAYPVTSAIASSVATGVTFATSVGPVPSAPTYHFTGINSIDNIQSPDWGLTDVEAPLFNTIVNLGSSKALNDAQLSNISPISTSYDNVFGVAISSAAYNGAAFDGHPKTNFNKAEVTGILTGAIQNWNQLFADDGTQLPSAPIWLLDSATGSGTKAAANN